MIEQLARDDDETVCVPVLRESPLLSDEFLVEIIQSGPVQSALKAISGRHGLGADVADAIVGTEDRFAITSLLSNESAQIREETLDRLADGAAEFDDWHAPLIGRPTLSAKAATSLSRYVTEALLEKLRDRDDLDPSVAKACGDAMIRRKRKAPKRIVKRLSVRISTASLTKKP